MSRFLLALVLGATTSAATGCYGTTGYVGYDNYGYYDAYPYYYGGVYTTYPYYYRTHYPYYTYGGHYYRSPYYRSHYYGHNYGHPHGTTVVRDHRTHSSPGYHARSAPVHYSGARGAPGGVHVHSGSHHGGRH